MQPRGLGAGMAQPQDAQGAQSQAVNNPEEAWPQHECYRGSHGAAAPGSLEETAEQGTSRATRVHPLATLLHFSRYVVRGQLLRGPRGGARKRGEVTGVPHHCSWSQDHRWALPLPPPLSFQMPSTLAGLNDPPINMTPAFATKEPGPLVIAHSSHWECCPV